MIVAVAEVGPVVEAAPRDGNSLLAASNTSSSNQVCMCERVKRSAKRTITYPHQECRDYVAEESWQLCLLLGNEEMTDVGLP